MSVDLCRASGWIVGTLIEGREGGRDWWSESRIWITAIGEENVMARDVARRNDRAPVWVEVQEPERTWSLRFRDWREVAPELGEADGPREGG